MSIDAYALCPGGTGKKIKFCCADLVGELDKIGRMLEGEQSRACLDHVDRLTAKHPNRACLCTIKANLERVLGKEDEAEKTLQQLLASQPDNPVALAETALLAYHNADLRAGMSATMQSAQAAGGQIPAKLMEALLATFGSLLQAGYGLAARRYLLSYVQLTEGKDEQALTALLKFDQSPVSLLEKQTPAFLSCPESADYQEEFDSALMLAARMAYHAAGERFARLAEAHPDGMEIAWNLALCKTYTADDGAAAAWHKFSALAAASDDAVEALAQAQMLKPEEVADSIDLLKITMPILNIDDCQARAMSDRRLMGISPAAFQVEEGEPPPKSGFVILDRALPETSQGMAADDAPRVLGQCWLFGKQTDRDARLEIVALRGDKMDRTKAALVEIAAESLAATSEESVLASRQAIEVALSEAVVLPRDTPPELTAAANTANRRRCYFDVLTRTPLKMLGGKSPEQAASDPAFRTPLLALILNLESGADGTDIDFDELRRHWGLPVPEPIVVAANELLSIAPCRYRRLDCPRLDDDALLRARTRAIASRAGQAIRNTSLEILNRPGLADRVDLADVYGVLAELEEDVGPALEYIDKARDAAVKAGQSSAPWDLQELRLLGEGHDPARFGKMMDHLLTEHINEPGVREAIQQLFYSLGMIDEYGRPTALGNASADEPAIVGAEAEAGKLWTPDSERPQEKSGLWLPGQS
ncbi:MAG: hypothetical protein AB7O62_14390 [Pirellulales bacterium]